MQKLIDGTSCLFLKFFDKKEYAIDFLNGKFRIFNPKEYKNENFTPLYDASEGKIFEVFKIDTSKKQQCINFWDGTQFVLFNEEAINNGYNIKNGDYLITEKEPNINIFCCAFITDTMTTEEIHKLFTYYRKNKKIYCVMFDIYDFLYNITKAGYTISHGEVLYSNDKKPNPFVKPVEYSIENEYRIAFVNNKNDYTDIKINKFKSAMKILKNPLEIS